jgi:hypothetical protein
MKDHRPIGASQADQFADDSTSAFGVTPVSFSLQLKWLKASFQLAFFEHNRWRVSWHYERLFWNIMGGGIGA